VYNENSKVLVLGSFPSVKSRESEFFYGHPQNRFWRLLSELLEQPLPQSNDEKKLFLLENRIALWDVIESCEITGSSDSSIRNAAANDLSLILDSADISAVFTNGGTADRLYQKYCFEMTKLPAVKLPSTSPANASFSLEKLKLHWAVLKDSLY